MCHVHKTDVLLRRCIVSYIFQYMCRARDRRRGGDMSCIIVYIPTELCYGNLNFPKRQCVCCIMRASHWKLARIGRRLCYGTRAVNAAHDIHIWRSQCIWGHICTWWYAISAVFTSYTTFCIYVNDKYLKFLWIILVNVCRLSGFFGFVCAPHRAECS